MESMFCPASALILGIHSHESPCCCVLLADLLSKLSGERDRWNKQLAGLDRQLSELPMTALLAAAFVTYLPAYPEDVRAKVLQDWSRCVGYKLPTN